MALRPSRLSTGTARWDSMWGSARKTRSAASASRSALSSRKARSLKPRRWGKTRSSRSPESRSEVTAVTCAFGCTESSRSNSAPMYPVAPATAILSIRSEAGGGASPPFRNLPSGIVALAEPALEGGSRRTSFFSDKRLPLGVLELGPRAGLAVLLPLFHAWIAREATRALEGLAQLVVEPQERTGNTVPDRASLAGGPAAAHVDHGVELPHGARELERLADHHPQRLPGKVVLEGAAVHHDAPGARPEPDTGHGGLAPSGSVVLGHHRSHRAPLLFFPPTTGRQRLGLLGGVRMLRPSVHLELLEHRAAQTPLREHALHRPLDDSLRVTLEHPLGADFAHAPDIAGVPAVQLVGHLPARQVHLLGIDHHDVVADVQIRRERHLVLASQDRGHAGRQPAEHLTLGVHQEPLPVHRLMLRQCSRHGLRPASRTPTHMNQSRTAWRGGCPGIRFPAPRASRDHTAARGQPRQAPNPSSAPNPASRAKRPRGAPGAEPVAAPAIVLHEHSGLAHLRKLARANDRGKGEPRQLLPRRLGLILPVHGHKAFTGQRGQSGFRARQVFRPWMISRCVAWVHRARGMTSQSWSCTLSGSSARARPSRCETRNTCVSTARAGTPKAFPRTTLAVLRPTPGSAVNWSSVLGTTPPWRSTRALPTPISARALALKNPVE